MKRHFRNYIRPITLALAFLLCTTAFYWRGDSNYYYDLNNGLELFGEVYREIFEDYVDEVDPETFINAGIDGMLGTLDPYTVYLRKQDLADVDLLTNGFYAGIGIRTGIRGNDVIITDILDGYSAQRMGLRVGDRIVEVDGVLLQQYPLDTLRAHTRGAPGSTMSIAVARHGLEQPLQFTLTREHVEVHSVTYSGIVADSVGYIKLERFTTNAGDEVRTALLQLQQQARLTGIILDLRDNPGGVLEAAVDVAAKFLPSGSVIVSTRGRSLEEERIFRSNETPIAGSLPLVVLINDRSASASEIVAGAIQDLQRGVIAGTTSFGKGLVQSIRQLPHQAALKITTARYYTPSGRCIQRTNAGPPLHAGETTEELDSAALRGGIVPDLVIGNSDTLLPLEQMKRHGFFFDFATEYTGPLQSLPNGFTAEDSLYQQFGAYVLGHLKDTAFADPVMMDIAALERTMRARGYNRSTIEAVSSMRSAIIREYRATLLGNKGAIRTELYKEITGRFMATKAHIAQTLPNEEIIQSTLMLLSAGGAGYRAVLSQ